MSGKRPISLFSYVSKVIMERTFYNFYTTISMFLFCCCCFVFYGFLRVFFCLFFFFNKLDFYPPLYCISIGLQRLNEIWEWQYHAISLTVSWIFQQNTCISVRDCIVHGFYCSKAKIYSTFPSFGIFTDVLNTI